MPGPSPVTPVLRYASISKQSSIVTEVGLGIEFVPSGNLVQITNVDISQPIMVSAYVNSTSSSLPTITFSDINEISNGSGSKSTEGVKTSTIIGNPSSPIIGIYFGGSSLGTNYDYTVVAYQVTF